MQSGLQLAAKSPFETVIGTSTALNAPFTRTAGPKRPERSGSPARPGYGAAVDSTVVPTTCVV